MTSFPRYIIGYLSVAIGYCVTVVGSWFIRFGAWSLDVSVEDESEETDDIL